VVDVDSDTSGDTHTFVIVSPPEHGVATVVASDQVGSIMLGWDPVDQPGLAGYRLYYRLMDADTTTIDVGAQTSYRITDLIPGSFYAFVVTTYDIHGKESDFSQELLYRVPYAGEVLYTPHLNFHGTDSFTYRAIDAAGASVVGSASVTVKPVNDVPIVVHQVVSTQEDIPVTTDNVLTNAVDTDGDSLQITSFTPAAHGIVVENGDGTFTYTPVLHFSGTDRFTYVVSDGNGGSATGTVVITVVPMNDDPATNALSLSPSENEAFTLPAQWPASDVDGDSVLANAVDRDGDSCHVIACTQAAHGTVINNGNGTFTYTPQADFRGSDSFTYTVTASSDRSTTATVTVTPVNDPPVAAPQHVITPAERPVALTLVGHDKDGDPLTFIVMTPPTHGALSGIPPFVTYTPDSDFHGTDSLTFRVDDGTASSLLVVVTLLVTATALSNGGFETGDFTAWTTLGEARIETVAYGSGPTEGTFQALLSTAGSIEGEGDTTGGAVRLEELETFLGLQPGSLDSISTSRVVEGSAIKRTFTVQAGTVLSFAWNFLTNEVTNLDEPTASANPDANDLVFVTITPLSLVADTFWTFVLSAADFLSETGFATFTVTLPTTGHYTLGIGVVDVGEALELSGLLLDNFTLTPPANP
jgi:hypothetical protein